MTQRLTYAAAAALAAFVVVLMGALGGYVVLHRTADPLVAAAANSGSAAAPAEIPPPPDDLSGTQPSGYAVSAEEAASIALNSVPGSSLLQQPRLVNVNGTVAYEVPLSTGTVYVDAAGGQVLYNGATTGNPQPGRGHRRRSR